MIFKIRDTQGVALIIGVVISIGIVLALGISISLFSYELVSSKGDQSKNIVESFQNNLDEDLAGEVCLSTTDSNQNPEAYTLTISIGGDGSVTQTPDQAEYPSNTLVELEAVAVPGWKFDKWTGDLSGNLNSDTIIIDGDKSVNAHFIEEVIVNWFDGPTGSSTDRAYDVTVDSSGNVYVVGDHNRGLNFGDGHIISDEYGYGVFVAKYTNEGAVQWLRGPTGSGSDYCSSVATDSDGNVYITGQYWNELDFHDAIILPNRGYDSIFVAKYDSEGTIQWATCPIQTDGKSYGEDIAVDGNGNVYVTGYHEDAINFGNDVVIEDKGSKSVFVVKYEYNILDGSYVAQWATGPTGPGSDYGNSIAVDSIGNIYVAGQHGDGLDTNDNTILDIPDDGYSGVFVIKYDNNGGLLWAKGPKGDVGHDYACSIVVDNNDENVYVTGTHYGGLDFGNDVSINDEPELGVGMFLVKYNNAGIAQWARGPDGGVNDHGCGVAIDESNNVYVTGDYGDGYSRHYIDFDNDVSIPNDPDGDRDVFVVKYNSAGTARWVKRLIGTGGEDYAGSIVVDNNGVYMVGYHENGLDVDNDESLDIPNEGNYGVYLIKYS